MTHSRQRPRDDIGARRGSGVHRSQRHGSIPATRRLTVGSPLHRTARSVSSTPRLERLRSEASVEPFSPVAGDSVPDADAIYLPGGYPELHGESLETGGTLDEIAVVPPTVSPSTASVAG